MPATMSTTLVLASNATMRLATDAALELARSGMSLADAVCNVSSRFDLRSYDALLVELRVERALAMADRPEPIRATVAKVGRESLAHSPDDAELHARQIRALASIEPAPSVVIAARAHAATIRQLTFQLAEVVESMRTAGLLAGDDLAAADAKVARMHRLVTEADHVASEIDIATRSGRMIADAFGGKAGA